MLLASVLIASAVVAQPQRPNIIFIFTDDHASHAIGAYGSVINETPNLDRLAREGMLFLNCFVGNSICAPSRATIQTGKHSHKNGVLDNILEFDGTQQTFPKILRENGYLTAIIGKWHLKSEPVGFDYFDILPGQGHYYTPDFINKDGRYRLEGYVTDIITEKTIDWLKTKEGTDQPFMLMMQHKAPHRAWWPAPRHLNKYDGRRRSGERPTTTRTSGSPTLASKATTWCATSTSGTSRTTCGASTRWTSRSAPCSTTSTRPARPRTRS